LLAVGLAVPGWWEDGGKMVGRWWEDANWPLPCPKLEAASRSTKKFSVSTLLHCHLILPQCNGCSCPVVATASLPDHYSMALASEYLHFIQLNGMHFERVTEQKAAWNWSMVTLG
jgi:hypothetical protein